MSAELTAVFFALLSAISWGAGDFSGGVASRRLNPYLIALLVHSTGLLLFAVLAVLRSEAFQPQDIPWSLAAGLAGCVGLVFLYRAFEVGQMGLAAPIAGVVGAGLAALVGFGLEGLPTPLQLLGFGVGLLGVWLAARPEGGAGPGLCLSGRAGLWGLFRPDSPGGGAVLALGPGQAHRHPPDAGSGGVAGPAAPGSPAFR